MEKEDAIAGALAWQNAAHDDLKSTFEADTGEVPYWQQGNDDFGSPEAKAMRAALRLDARVLRALEMFWQVYAKESDDTVSKEEYLKVHVKLALVLIPDITPEEVP